MRKSETSGTIASVSKAASPAPSSLHGATGSKRSAGTAQKPALFRQIAVPSKMSGNFPKRCECCGKVYSESAFRQLEHIGDIDYTPSTSGPSLTCEMRDCSCGNTLARLWFVMEVK